MNSGVDSTQLLDTLTRALTQCQEQVRVLAVQANTITRLQEENERLKQDHEKALAALKQGSIESEHHQELERLYQRDFDKQLQIDQLQEMLRQIKVKTKQQGLLHAITSSPLPPSSAVQPTPKHALHGSRAGVDDVAVSEEYGEERTSETGPPSHSEATPNVPSKRTRARSPPAPPPLSEASSNTVVAAQSRSRSYGGRKRQRPSDEITSVVPEIAEDGESYSNNDDRLAHQRFKSTRTSVYERLQDLMSLPTPTKQTITKPTPLPAPQPRRQQSDPTSKAVKIEPSTQSDVSPNLIRKSSSARSTILSPPPSVEPNEDEEPFRARPPQRLDLCHFKLNPAANSGLDYAYTEVVRGRQERRCLPGCTRPECCGSKLGPLAANLPPRLAGKNLTAEELLVGYLGPGSESRIRALTPTAKANLLHEAKLKLVADAYGKAHRGNTERAASPPGYWNTDMPGSQEYEDLRLQAKRMERDEVMRRYHEAMRGYGRWMFADE